MILRGSSCRLASATWAASPRGPIRGSGSTAPDLQIDIALASEAISADALRVAARSDQRLDLHFDARNVAELMAVADMAIGAGGASTWERCCLGLPTLAVIVADNQRDMIRRLAMDGAVLAVDMSDANFEADFDVALDRLTRMDVRTDLRMRSINLCDGRGAERVADAILSL